MGLTSASNTPTRLPFALLLALGLAAAARAGGVTVDQGPGRVSLDNGLVHARIDLAAGTLAIEADGLHLGPFHAEAQFGGQTLTSRGAGAGYRLRDEADALGRGKTVALLVPDPAHPFALDLTLREGRREVTIVLALGGKPAPDIRLSLVAPASALASLAGHARVLCEAHQSWDVPALSDLGPQHSGEGWCAIHDLEADVTAVLGALSQRQKVQVTVGAAGLQVAAAASPGGPDGGVRSETLALVVARGANLALEAHADATARLAGAAAPARAAWGFTTWYAVPDADPRWLELAAEGLAAIDGGRGEGVLQMDDLWQDRLGDWQPNGKFPAGMAAVADLAHGRGLKAGLWIAPFGVAEGSQPAREHPEWLVRDAAGAPLVVEERAAWGGRIHRLDPAVPGVIPFLAGLASRLTYEWRFDLLKLDFLYWGLVEPERARPGADPREAYRRALDAVGAAARPGTTLLLSGMPLGFAPGRGAQVRTGPDAFVDRARHLGALRAAARRAHLQGAAFHADPDVLNVRPEIASGEARLRATFLAMAGGPVFLGDLFWSDPPERRAMAERLIPPHGLRGRPLDLFTADIPGRWTVAEPRGTSLAAGLVPGDSTREVFLPVAADRGPRLVLDVWEDRLLGIFASAVPLAIAPWDAALLALRKAEAPPGVLAADAHLVASAIVGAESFAGTSLRLSVRGKPGAESALVLAAPGDLEPFAATRARLEQRPDGLYRAVVPIDGSGQAELEVSYRARALPPATPAGRPSVEPPAGVRVVLEEEIGSAAELEALLAEASAGLFIVVLPPPLPAPAPVGYEPSPWREHLLAGVEASAPAGSIAADLARVLVLPDRDDSGVFLALRPGADPPPVLQGSRLERSAHAAVAAGRGAIVRLGRLADDTVRGIVDRLGDESVRDQARGLLAEASRLRRLWREATSLDGAWRFRTDPDGEGEAGGWASPSFDDAAWETIAVPATWESEGHPGYDGEAWYRRRIEVARDWRGLDLLLELQGVDDQDETYFEGRSVGQTQVWNAVRRYRIPAALVPVGRPGLLAVRVRDRTANGGIYLPVRLGPHPEALLSRLSGNLVGLLDESEAAPRTLAARLFAVREGDAVRLVVERGRAPFPIGRGAFPRGDALVPLGGGPTPLRSLVDPDPGARAAYRIEPP